MTGVFLCDEGLLFVGQGIIEFHAHRGAFGFCGGEQDEEKDLLSYFFRQVLSEDRPNPSRPFGDMHLSQVGIKDPHSDFIIGVPINFDNGLGVILPILPAKNLQHVLNFCVGL